MLAVHRHNHSSSTKVRKIAWPGLGTATGRMAPNEAARQMALAYRWHVSPVAGIDWPTAQRRQAMIGRGGDLMAATTSQPPPDVARHA